MRRSDLVGLFKKRFFFQIWLVVSSGRLVQERKFTQHIHVCQQHPHEGVCSQVWKQLLCLCQFLFLCIGVSKSENDTEWRPVAVETLILKQMASQWLNRDVTKALPDDSASLPVLRACATPQSIDSNHMYFES